MGSGVTPGAPAADTNPHETDQWEPHLDDTKINDPEHPNEQLGGPHPLIGHRTGIAVGLTLLAALVVAAAVRSTRQRSTHPEAFIPSSAHPIRTSRTPLIPTLAPVATDVLVPGTSSGGSSVDYGHGREGVELEAEVVNESDSAVVFAGPASLHGRDGRLVPHATVKFVTDRTGPADADAVVHGIGPHQRVRIVIVVSYDCTRNGAGLRLSTKYPQIVIPLTGFPTPATFDFSYFFDTPDGSLLPQVCRTAGH